MFVMFGEVGGEGGSVGMGLCGGLVGVACGLVGRLVHVVHEAEQQQEGGSVGMGLWWAGGCGMWFGG